MRPRESGRGVQGEEEMGSRERSGCEGEMGSSAGALLAARGENEREEGIVGEGWLQKGSKEEMGSGEESGSGLPGGAGRDWEGEVRWPRVRWGVGCGWK